MADGDGTRGSSFDLLGVPGVALRIYSAVLSGSARSVADLAGDLGLTTQQVREGLDLLSEQTFLHESQDSQGAFRPVSPEVAFGRLVEGMEAQLHAREVALSQVRSEVAAFIGRYRQQREAEASRHLEHFSSRDAVVTRLDELQRAARGEVMALVTNRPSAAALTQARVGDAGLLARGVRVRTIYLEGHALDPALREYVEWFHGEGALVRLAPTLPVRMILYDREAAVVAVDPAEPAHGAVVVRGEGVLAALALLFELLWDGARDAFAPPADVDPGHLSPLQAELLALLARGHKDESAARHLGLSVRTVRRLVTEVAALVGADSRFELGVKARERGWV